jgi:transposase
LSLRRVRRKLLSVDPQRPAILSRIRQIWRHLPDNGVLLFFDVKPVYVKAYGGRRYTSEARLVLPRQQKTRGQFYIFAVYEVNSGRVRWAFLEGKSSPCVIRFLRQIRRWYPDQEVWVALDQDRAHPCHSRATRQAMRARKLHWVSLPKGSPDDNPVETLFGDVQLMILDNSNDADVVATQRRISAHWRHRNRRRDRHIRIPYLGDSDKQ